MAFDEGLAERVRDLFDGAPDVVEKKMFGGMAFMVGGHMACGIIGDDLLVRVARDDYDTTLALPHARQMDMTGRPMRGFVHEVGYEYNYAIMAMCVCLVIMGAGFASVDHCLFGRKKNSAAPPAS